MPVKPLSKHSSVRKIKKRKPKAKITSKLKSGKTVPKYGKYSKKH